MDTLQAAKPQSTEWTRTTARNLIATGAISTGPSLILGASDTGKSTLAAEIARRLCTDRPVALIDSDIGQSRIGPPAAIGYSVLTDPNFNMEEITPDGIRFVGDITPVAHLLQFTAALAWCVNSLAPTASHIIIDTPGLVTGSAATALWWTACDVIRPTAVIALQHQDELADVLRGLAAPIHHLAPPADIPAKSPLKRRSHRAEMFTRYFQHAVQHTLKLSQVAVRTCRHIPGYDYRRRLAVMRNAEGDDTALALVKQWQPDEDRVTLTAPPLEIESIRCLIIGDAKMDLA